MGPAGRKKRFTQRSRKGCFECRRDHRKCDELRPTCGRCRSLRQGCTYGQRVSWGGRAFDRSSFGQLMASEEPRCGAEGQVHILHSQGDDPGQAKRPFIYGTVRSNAHIIATASKKTTPLLCDYISLFPRLSSPGKVLLDYFVHAADSFSCDDEVKDQFCGTFIQMAANNDPLMASILALAAAHRVNIGLEQDKEELGALHLSAVKQLRMGLSTSADEPLMAAALLLCYTEVISGGANGSSWRLHLEGAGSLFAARWPAWTIHSSDPTRAFICQCFVSLVALANVSGLPPSCAVSERALGMVSQDGPRPYIDNFTAYSSDLMSVLFELGQLIRDRQQVSSQCTTNTAMSIEERSLRLLNRLDSMTVAAYAAASSTDKSQRRINELFRQATILQIHQRIRGLPPSSREIQRLVNSILALLSTFEIKPGPGFGVLLFYPAFSAGTGAVNLSQRQQVRDLLNSMVQVMGFMNLRQGLNLLEILWSHRDCYGEYHSNASWETLVAENVDIILY
uniref:Zn(2)-C6 fungal-type domain-containing protein n=1 Tax=Bionectria ochroleuca TaxID=29856 RepID=A0A8H7K159_BIOOC